MSSEMNDINSVARVSGAIMTELSKAIVGQQVGEAGVEQTCPALAKQSLPLRGAQQTILKAIG